MAALDRIFGAPAPTQRAFGPTSGRRFGPTAGWERALSRPSGDTGGGLERMPTIAPASGGARGGLERVLARGQPPTIARTPSTPQSASGPERAIEQNAGGGDTSSGMGSIAGGSHADVSPADVAGFSLGGIGPGGVSLGHGQSPGINVGVTGNVGLSTGNPAINTALAALSSALGIPTGTSLASLLAMVAPSLGHALGVAGLGVGGFQSLTGLAGLLANAFGVPTTHALAQAQGGINDPDPNEAAAALQGLQDLSASIAAAGPGGYTGLSDAQAAQVALGNVSGASPQGVYSAGPQGGYVYGSPSGPGGPSGNVGPSVPGVGPGLGQFGQDLAAAFGFGGRGFGSDEPSAPAAAGIPGAPLSAEDAAANAPTPPGEGVPGGDLGGAPGGEPDFHHGGLVGDRQPGPEEDITALEGEYVSTPEATRRYGPLLELLNQASMTEQERGELPGRDRLSAIRRRRAGLPDQGWRDRPEFARDAGPTRIGSGFHRVAPRGIERLLSAQ